MQVGDVNAKRYTHLLMHGESFSPSDVVCHY